MSDLEDGLVQAVREAMTPEQYRAIGGTLVDVHVEPDGDTTFIFEYRTRSTT